MLPCYELWLCSLASEGLGCGFLMSIEAIPSKSNEHCSGTKAGLWLLIYLLIIRNEQWIFVADFSIISFFFI